MFKTYILSELADKDLEDIFEYTTSEFGLNQAIEYLNEIHEYCEIISLQNEIGIERLEIKINLRSLAFKKHIIFCHILSEKIVRIERIIHGSRDITNQFNNKTPL